MPIVTAGQVLQSAAAAYLNDSQRSFWPDSVLIPCLQEACHDLFEDMYLNGLPTVDKTVLLLNFLAGNTVISLTTTPALPTDLRQPVKLWERDAGGAWEDFEEMVRKTWAPNLEQDSDLTYWMWQQNELIFLGSTANKDLRLDYEAGLPVPQSESDTIPLMDGETYLAPKTAAYANLTLDRYTAFERLTAIAELKLSKIIRTNVKNQQSQPTRQRPYRRMRQYFIGR
jgi:hypothetical protein